MISLTSLCTRNRHPLVLLGFNRGHHHCQRLGLAGGRGAGRALSAGQRSQGAGGGRVRVMHRHTADHISALTQINTVETEKLVNWHQCVEWMSKKKGLWPWTGRTGPAFPQLEPPGWQVKQKLKVDARASTIQGEACPHLAGWNFRSSSVSVSLWMVMMLTAGLGVSQMMIGCDSVALAVGGVTPVANPLEKRRTEKKMLSL